MVCFRIVYIATIFLGSVISLGLVWNIADCMNALMAIPNLISLLCLSGIIVHETRKYLWRDQLDKDMDEKEPTSLPVQMEFLKKLMGAIQELSLPKNPPSPEKTVDWTISQLAKQITMSAETRKAYKRAFMMSLHDNGKAQGKK